MDSFVFLMSKKLKLFLLRLLELKKFRFDSHFFYTSINYFLKKSGKSYPRNLKERAKI